MRDYIILNNKNSNEIKGLLIQNLPPITKPRIRAEIEEIDGRDGDIVTPLGYGAYDKAFSIGLYGDFDINEVIKYFDSEGIVVFSNEPNKYYNYKILEQIDFEKLIRFRTADVMMHVQPFKYSTTEGKETEEMETKTASGSEIDLPDTNNEKLQMEKLKGDAHQDTIDAEEGNENEDTNLAVNDVDPSKENYITLKGNTTQYNHDSANKLPNDMATLSLYGITITKNDDGTYTINGTTTQDFNWAINDTALNLQANTNYFLSGCATGGDAETYCLYISAYADTGNGVLINSSRAINDQVRIFIASGQTFNNAIFKPMLIEGTEAIPFEPYGMTTPSPQYPSEVKVVKGNNVVSVQGKNSFDLTKHTNTLDSKTTILNPNSYQCDLNGSWKGEIVVPIENLKSNTTYTISANVDSSATNSIISYLRGYNGSDFVNIIKDIYFDWFKNGYRFNSGEYERYELKMFIVGNQARTGIEKLEDLQIEEGNAKTDFVPYSKTDYTINLGTLELCKIGDYKDYLFKRNGKWYVHKEIGKYELDENTHFTQNWNSNTDNKTYCMLCTLNTNFGSNAIAISNILPYVSKVYGYDKIGIYQEKNSGGRIIFRVPKTIANSVSEFKTWLASNSMIVYTLIAPTEEEITDTSLIAQLDALHTAELQETSYINSTPAKEYPYINLKYNVVTPAPSPDRASEINKVTGNNVVSVSGKNLFDKDNANVINVYANNDIFNSGWRYSTIYIPCIANTTYTISREVLENNFVVATSVDVPVANGSYTNRIANNTGTAITITSGANDRYLSVYVKYEGDTSYTLNEILASIQIEQNSQATPYVPYSKTDYPISQGNIELCKIGNYQDYIYKNNGKWYKHKAINKIVLNGSEDWNYTNNVFYLRYSMDTSSIAHLRVQNYVPYSNNFKGVINYHNTGQFYSNSQNNNFGLNLDAIQHNIYVRYDSITSTEDFKTWLSTHNTEVYYPLATPTEEEITNSTLIEQLEALDNIYNQKGTTYIKTNPEGNNMPLTLDVSYTESRPITITNSGNIYSKPIFTIYGEGNIGVYLNDIQLFDINLGSEEQITIDVAEMQAYNKETKALKNRLVTGNYDKFLLKIGENKISFSGIVKKFEIENYSRWI